MRRLALRSLCIRTRIFSPCPQMAADCASAAAARHHSSTTDTPSTPPSPCPRPHHASSTQLRHVGAYKAAGVMACAWVRFSARRAEPAVLLVLEDRAKERNAGPLLSLPGGKVEAQDARDPLRTALREFHEETGNVFSDQYAEALSAQLRLEAPKNACYVSSGKYYVFTARIPHTHATAHYSRTHAASAHAETHALYWVPLSAFLSDATEMHLPHNDAVREGTDEGGEMAMQTATLSKFTVVVRDTLRTLPRVRAMLHCEYWNDYVARCDPLTSADQLLPLRGRDPEVSEEATEEEVEEAGGAAEVHFTPSLDLAADPELWAALRGGDAHRFKALLLSYAEGDRTHLTQLLNSTLAALNATPSKTPTQAARREGSEGTPRTTPASPATPSSPSSPTRFPSIWDE